jgi:hypothetical protein
MLHLVRTHAHTHVNTHTHTHTRAPVQLYIIHHITYVQDHAYIYTCVDFHFAYAWYDWCSVQHIVLEHVLCTTPYCIGWRIIVIMYLKHDSRLVHHEHAQKKHKARRALCECICISGGSPSVRSFPFQPLSKNSHNNFHRSCTSAPSLLQIKRF